MLVTFRANAKILQFSPGKIYYNIELTPLIEALLRADVKLSLIDPPSLDIEPEPTKPEPAPAPKKEAPVVSDSKSTSPPKPDRQTSGQHNRDRTPQESGERSEGTPSTSPTVERNELVYGRDSGEDTGRETSE